MLFLGFLMSCNIIILARSFLSCKDLFYMNLSFSISYVLRECNSVADGKANINYTLALICLLKLICNFDQLVALYCMERLLSIKVAS